MAECADGHGASSSEIQEPAHKISQMTDKIFRKSIELPLGNQSQTTINTATVVMVCEQDGIELAGTPIVAPRMRPPR